MREGNRRLTVRLSCGFQSPRFTPRKLIAYVFTKQVTARAAVSARAAPQRAKTILIGAEDKIALRNSACSVSHSLTKPLNGGTAEIARHPTSTIADKPGTRRDRPPSRSISRVPATAST